MCRIKSLKTFVSNTVYQNKNKHLFTKRNLSKMGKRVLANKSLWLHAVTPAEAKYSYVYSTVPLSWEDAASCHWGQ